MMLGDTLNELVEVLHKASDLDICAQLVWNVTT